MHIIVGGCGQLGAAIAEQLSEDSHNDVVIVDLALEAFDRLGTAFNGDTVQGDVTDRDILVRAGAERADAFVAVTRFDNKNLMAVQIAERLYGVPNTVARLFDPSRAGVYRKLGIRYVSGTVVLASLFLDELSDAVFRRHLHFDHGDVQVVEMRAGASAHGMTIADFEVDGRLRVSAVRRGDRVFVPRTDDRLERGDVVVAGARDGIQRTVRRLLDDRELED